MLPILKLVLLAAEFIATSGDNVSLVGGDVSLGNGANLTIDTNIADGETNGGNISIAGGIDGTSDENLTLDAHATGTGTITLAKVGGGDTPASALLRSTP